MTSTRGRLIPENRGIGTCPTDGKQRYLTRRDAKAALRVIHPGSHGMNTYQCGDYWHYGHKPHWRREGLDRP